MVLAMQDYPFERTVCACADCQSCCRRQPGYLIPGDVDRLVAATGRPAKEFLVASPGAVVMNLETRVQRRIGTITPKFHGGKCVLLDDNGRCTVHAVAPFGCAFFDTHMKIHEGQQRSRWGLEQIVKNQEYKTIRSKLSLTKHYKPWLSLG